ncbi:ABC transporter permease [Brevibacillus borstelensis]|jgi:ABC-2 type transport system permease protein|uniref:ABC transporter permease n=1 Tax=Brevibacillus borstelensis TaxID=45462 RepID=UPI001FA95DCD|nr:ABC transporter permease subunit [Brevibacillus borstelensis]
MWAICIHEFIRLFRSVKSLITIAFIAGVSYWVSDLVNQAAGFISQHELTEGHALGVFALVMLFGPLFVFGLSHDMINREVSSRTVRFLVTRTSRFRIVLGKCFGVLLFWLCCMLVTFGTVLASVHTFDVKTFLECMSMLVYSVSLCLLLSVLIARPSYTMFGGSFSVYSSRFSASGRLPPASLPPSGSAICCLMRIWKKAKRTSA